MSGPIFVLDAEGKPLMPMAPAYARKLLRQHKASWRPHHAFSIIQLSQVVDKPVYRNIGLRVVLHLHMAELFLIADGPTTLFPLLRVTIDLRTDIPWRMRRRAAHRQRRRARRRYRLARRYRQPYTLRRPSRAKDHRYRASLLPLKAVRRPISAVMRWRSQAVLRTIQALRRIVPLTHIAITPASPHAHHKITQSEVREWLVNTDGVATADGQRVGTCAYCGSSQSRLQVEHIIPRSQGGSDGRHNRVLSCAACNARKGGRTPEQAGMQLRISRPQQEHPNNRANAYIHQTVALLHGEIAKLDLELVGEQKDRVTVQSQSSFDHALLKESSSTVLHVVAKPIARQTKQIFHAHNYGLKTPLRPGFVRIGTTIKRRVTTNRALWRKQTTRTYVRVVGSYEQDAEAEGQRVVLGMFCECKRAGNIVRGIVSAIHSSGRVTLTVPTSVTSTRVEWKRIVVSPRKHLRILGNTSVIFICVLTSGDSYQR